MAHDQHSTLGEGLLTGFLGGLIVELCYLALGAGRGSLVYLVIHFGWFCLFGIGLAALVHQAIRNPAFRMGIWLYLVIGTVFWFALSYMLVGVTRQIVPWWTTLTGTILGVAFMGFLLTRRHPALRATPAPLGDEVRSPPHPPRA